MSCETGMYMYLFCNLLLAIALDNNCTRGPTPSDKCYVENYHTLQIVDLARSRLQRRDYADYIFRMKGLRSVGKYAPTLRGQLECDASWLGTSPLVGPLGAVTVAPQL